MAEPAFPGARQRRSAVYRLDPRFKLGLTAVATTAAAAAGPAGVAALLLLACALHAATGRAPAWSGLRGLLALCLLIVAARGLGDTAAPRWLLFSQPGLAAGLLYAVRLLVMALAGSLLASTTTSAALRASIAWLLRPLPRRVGGRAAAMAGLALASLPLLAREVAEVRLARTARLAERARPISRRVLSLVRPLVRKTLLRADTLAAAMEARCYSDATGTAPLPRPAAWEWAAAAACAAALAAAALL